MGCHCSEGGPDEGDNTKALAARGSIKETPVVVQAVMGVSNRAPSAEVKGANCGLDGMSGPLSSSSSSLCDCPAKHRRLVDTFGRQGYKDDHGPLDNLGRVMTNQT